VKSLLVTEYVIGLMFFESVEVVEMYRWSGRCFLIRVWGNWFIFSFSFAVSIFATIFISIDKFSASPTKFEKDVCKILKPYSFRFCVELVWISALSFEQYILLKIAPTCLSVRLMSPLIAVATSSEKT